MSLRRIRLTVGAVPTGTAYTWSYPNSDGKVYVIPTYQMSVVGTDDKKAPVLRDFEVLRFGVHRTVANTTPRIVGMRNLQTYVIRRWIPTYKVHSFPSREDGAWQVHGNFLIHDGPDDPYTQLYATAGCIEVCGAPNGFVEFNQFLATLAGATKPTYNEQMQQIANAGCMSITYLGAKLPPVQVK